MIDSPQTHLDLSFSINPIAELESKVPDPSKLLSLDLTSCGLQQLPPILTRATALRKIALGMNPLNPQSLEILSAFPHLEVLDLQRTGLNHIPQAIAEAKNLQSLDLSHNQLTDWPFLTEAPPKLSVLRLFGNPFKALPKSTLPMPQLKELSLGSSQKSVEDLPASFIAAFSHLQSLRLWGSLTQLPETLSELKDLNELDLRANKLTDDCWGILCKLTTLRELQLQENQLSSVPAQFQNLTQLRVLELQKNQIATVSPALWSSALLERVDLSDNLIEKLPAPEQSLAQLKELWLARNQLSALPDALQHFSALRNLDVEDNKLKALPPSILEMPKLSEPIFTGNAFVEAARPLVQGLEDLIYKRNPFARLHWPRFEATTSVPNEKTQTLPLSDDVVREAQRLGAKFQKRSRETESWPTAGNEWPLTVAFQSWLYDLEWPEHCYFDLQDDEHQIWSVDFSKPRPVADFECSFSHPYICLADYHGGNELLLIRLDDDVPGDPMLYHLDHEDGSVPDAEPVNLRLSTFLSKLQRN